MMRTQEQFHMSDEPEDKPKEEAVKTIETQHQEPQEAIGSKETESMVKNLKPFLETLGGRKINLSLVTEQSGKTMSFSHESNTVEVNLSFLQERGLSNDEIAFGLSHEIGHLIQLCKDPEGYINCFNFVERRAREKAKDDNERQKLEQIYHQLFNVLLDINDNQTVKEQIVPYHPGEGKKADVPVKLYAEKLFPAKPGQEIPDYRESPLHHQFLNFLLQKNMTGREAELAPEVKEALTKKIPVFGEQLTVEEFISRYIQPSKMKTGEIVSLSKQFLLPVFEGLIEIDKNQDKLQPEEVPDISNGTDSKARKEFAEKVIKDTKESKKSSGEKAKEFAKKQFERNLENRGFDSAEISELSDIKESCEEEVAKLTQLWHSFMRTLSTIEMEKERHHKVGSKINIPDLILQWQKLATKPETVEVMERDVPTSKESLLPKGIKLVLPLDMSGSMDEEKRMEVKKNAYIMAQSLKRFEDEVSYQFAQEKPVATETHFIGYGDTAMSLPEKLSEDENTDFYRSILDISKSLGGTQDDKALELAEERFTQEDLDRIKRGELVAIILEITDGETSTAENSKRILEQINNKGIFCRGIQIPGDIIKETTDEEKRKAMEKGGSALELVPPSGTFKEVFGEKGLRIDSISQLKNILSKLLEEAMETSYR